MKCCHEIQGGRCVGARHGFSLAAAFMGHLLYARHPAGPCAQRWDEQARPSQDTQLGLRGRVAGA